MCRVRHRTSAANAPPAIGTRPEFKAPFGLKKLETSGNYGSKRTSLFFFDVDVPKDGFRHGVWESYRQNFPHRTL